MDDLIWKSKCVALPKLFKQTKSGQVQVWDIYMEIVGLKSIKKNFKPTADTTVDIKTVYGKKDGKMQESSTRIEVGKNISKANETNVFQQGILEMTSKWKKQQDRLGYTLSEAESEVLKIRPMLLHEYKKYKKYIDFQDAWIQEKMDGVRALVYTTQPDGEVVIMSRQGGEFCHLNHIREAVKKLNLPPNIYLDGELFSRNLNFNEIVSICKKVKSLTDDKSIKLYLFDMIDLKEPNKPFTERYKELQHLLRKNHKEFVLVQAERVNNDTDVQKIYNNFIKRGAEGAVIRDGKSKYLVGKRSHYVLKLKPEDDAEFLIVGFKEGRGKDKGAVIFEMETENGKRFDARPALTYEERNLMFKNGEDYIGKQGTIKFMGLTPDGIPRFPVFKAVRDG